MSVFFTIIIPTYNSEKTIASTLSSLVCQSFKNYQVVIVDGQSTDKTLSIVNDFRHEFSNIDILSEQDNGVYDAMNKGIKLSSGEWLYFLGSDDTLFDHTVLDKVYQAAILSDSKVVYGNCIVDGDTDWAKDGTIYDGYFDFEKLMNKNICHQAIFYHKSVLDQLGVYNTEYKVCADWDLNHRFFSKYNFFFIDIVVAKFRSGGVSTNAFYLLDRFLTTDFAINISNYYSIPLENQIFRRYWDGILNSAIDSLYEGRVFVFLYRTYCAFILNKRLVLTCLSLYRKLKNKHTFNI